MSSIDFFTRLLEDPKSELVTILYYKIFEIRKVRSSIVTSCRSYQLIIILTLILLEKYKINIEDIITEESHGFHLQKIKISVYKQKMQKIINMINTDKSLILHQLISQNKRIESEMLTIFELRQEYFKQINDRISICPLCIYCNSAESFGSIVHYFTMIQFDEKIYLLSSYGSDYVSVPPKIIEIIDIGELNFFFMNLPNIKSMNEENFNKIRELFVKFFLPHGRSKLYDEETIDEEPNLKFKMLDYEEGKEKEWNYIRDNIFSFSVGLIINYTEELTRLLDELGSTKRKSKKRKSKKRKSKKSKSKKSKSKKRKSKKSKKKKN